MPWCRRQLALLLALFPAILMALAIVREKELGSITNLYVTPVTRLEFLLGKQLPYVAVAMVNFALMFVMALLVFQVPLKGSFPTLLLGDADLCHRDDRLRHADFGLYPHPDRRAVRHSHLDGAAGNDVRRHDGPGLLALRDRAQIMGRAVPDDLFPAGQRRHLHQGPRLRRSRPESGRARGLHPGPDAAEPSAAAQAGTLGQAAMRTLANIFWLGTKELRSFLSDFVLLGLVVYCLFACHYRAGAKQFAGSAQRVDRDRRRGPFGTVARGSRTPFCRPISRRRSRSPNATSSRLMNSGRYTFVIDIPPNFERDVLGRRQPAIQLDVDATAMVQAGLGAGLRAADHHDRDRQIFCRARRAARCRRSISSCASPSTRMSTTAWFTSVMGIINSITMLAIILAGAAVVREREHGTMDHLLVMPLTPFEIAMSKIWANGLVIVIAVDTVLAVKAKLVFFRSG